MCFAPQPSFFERVHQHMGCMIMCLGAADSAKDAADSAASKAKNAAPDLSDADPLPNSAESQSARDEVNKETSNAPGLGSIGKNLFQNLGGGGGSECPLASFQSSLEDCKAQAGLQ